LEVAIIESSAAFYQLTAALVDPIRQVKRCSAIWCMLEYAWRHRRPRRDSGVTTALRPLPRAAPDRSEAPVFSPLCGLVETFAVQRTLPGRCSRLPGQLDHRAPRIAAMAQLRSERSHRKDGVQ
jgi:hypothetical protein